MSLEDTIRGLTDAVTALNETLRANREALLGAAPAPAPEKPAAAPKAKVPKAEAPKAEPAPEPAPAITPTHIDYAAVSKAITDTFPKDREKVLSALKKFGAAKGPQLKPEDYAAFLAELA